jgi:precorrin-2/cobalt-factor-2 C20-methyltransferase
VVRALKAGGKYDDAYLVQFATMPKQTVCKLSEMTEKVTPYFSIIIVHGQGRRP